MLKEKWILRKREQSTEYMLWAYLETQYPTCSSLATEMSAEAYITSKPGAPCRGAFKNLQEIAPRLTVPQIRSLETTFDGMRQG